MENFETLLKGIGFTDISTKTADNKDELHVNIPDDEKSVRLLKEAVYKAENSLGNLKSEYAGKKLVETIKEAQIELTKIHGEEKGNAAVCDMVEKALLRTDLPPLAKSLVLIYPPQ